MLFSRGPPAPSSITEGILLPTIAARWLFPPNPNSNGRLYFPPRVGISHQEDSVLLPVLLILPFCALSVVSLRNSDFQVTHQGKESQRGSGETPGTQLRPQKQGLAFQGGFFLPAGFYRQLPRCPWLWFILKVWCLRLSKVHGGCDYRIGADVLPHESCQDGYLKK